MTNPEHARNGFALPAAVFALVVVGVLVTAGFYIARQESRISISNENAVQAFYLAERGVNEVLANPDMSLLSGLSMWEDTTVSATTGDGVWEVEITRMATQTYFLDGAGRITRGGQILGGANRRVGTVAKVFSANIDPPAALTTQGDLRVGGSSEIIGYDENPEAWEGQCDPTLEDKPGILIDEEDNITYSGNAYDVQGDPSIEEDPTLTSESLLQFGDLTWEELVSRADIEYLATETITNPAPDSVFTGSDWVCRPGQYNWGDPLNPGAACFNHFPIIYAHQNLKINSSAAGQGILLVEGDLELQGGFEFYGPVIVRGTLKTAGTGGHIRGGVIAANVDLETTTVLGNALVQYSGCTVTRALMNNSKLTQMRPLAQRSWVDLTNVTN